MASRLNTPLVKGKPIGLPIWLFTANDYRLNKSLTAPRDAVAQRMLNILYRIIW